MKNKKATFKVAFNFFKRSLIYYIMYNPLLAVQYAKQWAFTYNPNYYNFSSLGGDCTNFVSQCLYAGGIQMSYLPLGWYYNSLNDRAPAWTGVNEFWNFGISNTGAGLKLKETSISYLKVGDIIQLYNGQRFYHTLLVVNVEKGIRVSAHDNNAFNIPLTSYYFTSYRSARVFD